ncbi:MAG: hypothetical protein H6Q64_2338 [Firmicutes bacterium]|nr:hypothetical protein [Bacillota bacterium]
MPSEKNYSSYFLIISILFVSSLLLSNVITGKLILIAGWVLPGAVILFPLTYILGDVLTEVYGFQKTRLVIWLGFICNLLMAGIFTLVMAIPSPGFFESESAFAIVLGMTPRIVFASLVAYLTGEFCNSVLLSRLKILTAGRHLWLRTIGSSLAGEGLDTVIFITLAFAGTMPTGVLGQMMLFQYLFKIAYETAVTPLTYWVVNYLKRREGHDNYDYGVIYNPFQLD